MSPRRPRKQNYPLFLKVIPPLIILFLAVLFVYRSQVSPISPDSTQYQNFIIQKGQTLDSIASDLVEQKLIRSVPAFKLQVMISGLSRQIQAGDFSLSPSMSLSEIASALTHGTSDRRVTLLEGWRREQMAYEIQSVLEANNPDYAFDSDQFVTQTKNLEGHLYPDTYYLPKGSTTQQVIDLLTQNFAQKTQDLANNSGLSDSQALILASLLERESFSDAEKPVIAGILLNRLNADWPLQVDATVQYVKTTSSCKSLDCDWWPNDITRADIDLNSAFNTYSHPGLPPAPISNPSVSSIKAIYNPTPNSYWFYLHDNSGQIHYSSTIEEHNQNVARYL